MALTFSGETLQIGFGARTIYATNNRYHVVWGALPDIADTQVDDLLQTDQSVNEEYCPATIL